MSDKNGFLSLFKKEKPILAMLHLKGKNDADIEERMKREIDLYVENGVDCIIVENYFGEYHNMEKGAVTSKALK